MIDEYIGAGLAYPLEFSANRTVLLAGGVRKLEQSMRLILGTYPGERPMRPSFGARLRDFVFRGATLDTTTALADEVHRALELWEPRVDVERVRVHPDEVNPSLLRIDIQYLVKDTNDVRNLVFPFYTVPGEED